MKKLYTVIARTKSEWASGGPPVVAAVTSFSGLQAAKAATRSLINAATVSYAEIYGPEGGVVFKARNPAGA